MDRHPLFTREIREAHLETFDSFSHHVSQAISVLEKQRLEQPAYSEQFYKIIVLTLEIVQLFQNIISTISEHYAFDPPASSSFIKLLYIEEYVECLGFCADIVNDELSFDRATEKLNELRTVLLELVSNGIIDTVDAGSDDDDHIPSILGYRGENSGMMVVSGLLHSNQTMLKDIRGIRYPEKRSCFRNCRKCEDSDLNIDHVFKVYNERLKTARWLSCLFRDI